MAFHILPLIAQILSMSHNQGAQKAGSALSMASKIKDLSTGLKK